MIELLRNYYYNNIIIIVNKMNIKKYLLKYNESQINLSNLNIYDFPKQHNNIIKKINLNGNYIEVLNDNELMKNLRILTLKFNNINKLLLNNQYKKLLAIDLSYNNIEYLPSNLSYIFPNLIYLNISNNNIKLLRDVNFPKSLQFLIISEY